MSTMLEYKDKYAFHPGDTLEEWIDDSGLTVEEFAERAELPADSISKLVKGEENMSVHMAVQISRVTGIGADFWITMQAKYDTMLAEIEYDKELEKEKEVFKHLDYDYFCKNHGLWKCNGNIEKQIRCLRAFLQIRSLCELENIDSLYIAGSIGD